MKWLLVAVVSLAALLLVALLALFLLRFRDGAGRIEHSIEIDRPASEVWSWLVEPEKQRRWVGWLTEVHEHDPGGPGPGAEVTWVLIDPAMNGQRVEIHAEYTAFEPTRLSAMRLDSPGMFTGTARYELTDLGAGRTRLRYVSEFEMVSALARLFEPLVTPQARQKAVDDVGRLKSLAEAESSGRDAA